MKYFLTVDKIEEGTATLLGGENDDLSFNIPVALLPAGVKENDILAINISIDPCEREKREQTTDDLLKSLIAGKHLR